METVSSDLQGKDSGASVQPQKSPIITVPHKYRRRLSKPAYQIAKAMLIRIQGGRCAICGYNVHDPPGKEEIDHVDGNPSNNSPDNLRLVHKACNLRIRNQQLGIPAARASADNGKRVDVHGDEEDTLQVNRRIEPAWVEYIVNQLLVTDPLPKDLLTGMSAYYIGCSVATVGRYWKKHASMFGPFEIYRPKQGTQYLVKLRKR